MDGTRFSPDAFRRIFRKEAPLPPQLEGQYQSLTALYNRVNVLIPGKGIEFFDPANKGLRTEKKKEFNPKAGIRQVRETLINCYPDDNQHMELIKKYNHLLVGITGTIQTEDRDGISYGQIDQFLAGFPKNVLTGLGAEATAANVGQILDIGAELVKKHSEHVQDYSKDLRKDGINYDLGLIAAILAEKIPHAVAKLSHTNPNILETITDAAKTLPVHKFARYIDYIAETRIISPKARERMDTVAAQIGSLTTSNIETSSPFAQPDREGWRDEVVMGQERRQPLWEDLVSMVRCTEEDRREYGLKITQNNNEDKPLLGFNRGGDTSVFNRSPQGSPTKFDKAVFLHAHPAHVLSMEAFSPLVSGGDILATEMQDYGGGYLNVVGINGVTFHIGAADKSGDSAKKGIYYTVESGEYRGKQISPHKWKGDEVGIMAKLLETHKPYIYSIQGEELGIAYYFAHIPWEHIDKSVSFNDVCFSDGLAKLATKIEDRPALDIAPSLDDALKKSKGLRHLHAKRRYDDFMAERQRELNSEEVKQ